MTALYIVLAAWLSGPGGQTMLDPVFCAGCEAVTQNPAALGRRAGPDASLSWIGLRVRAASSSIRFGEVWEYVGQPRFLSSGDKQEILDRIGPGPLQLDGRADIEVIHGHYRVVGGAIDYEWLLRQSVPRDFFDLVLYGNQLGRTYDLGGLATDSLSLVRMTAAAGIPIYDVAALGISLAWLHGFNYVLTKESDGRLLTTPYAITGYTRQTRRQSNSGDGAALALGAVLQPASWLRLGVTVRDLPAGIYWHGNPGWREFATELESLDGNRYRMKPSLDSFLVKTNTYTATRPFFTTLPGILAAGIGYTPNSVVRLGVTANLRLKSDPFVAEPPLAAFRLDLHPVNWFELSLMPGWHRTEGYGGHVGLGFNYRGIVTVLDAEAWDLPSVSAATFRLRLGYDYPVRTEEEEPDY